MRPITSDEAPRICLYPGYVRVLIWALLIVGSWAVLVGAISVAVWLIERVSLVSGWAL